MLSNKRKVIVPILLVLLAVLVIGCASLPPAGNVATKGYRNGFQSYRYTDGTAWVNVWPEQYILWSCPTECSITHVYVIMSDGTMVEPKVSDYGSWVNRTDALIDYVILRTKCGEVKDAEEALE